MLPSKKSTLFTFQLILAAVLIGLLASLSAILLKRITEHAESTLFLKTEENSSFLILFPFLGLSLIYFLRYYLFHKKENKGIREIFESTATKSKTLPAYKIPSHLINGLITVAFGGSTGIEVSTVVAAAAIGSIPPQKETIFRKYKTELICAGITAGITALFGSPFAGILFAFEVISRKAGRVFLLTNLVAVAVSMGAIYLFNEHPLFAIHLTTWHYSAIPWFILLGVLCGLHAVYLTKCVILIKSAFGKINKHFYKIIVGSALLTVALFILPQLYGDGYHALRPFLLHPEQIRFTIPLMLTFTGILILKPIITSVTLASGGDGGVFAPGLFTGAFLGLLLAMLINNFFNADVIPVNFAVIGMAAMLSGSIHAPFTALFIACGVVDDYKLFFPILVVCLIAKYTSKFVFPFTVYTFTKAAS
jgi:chloride channel protein, CIC family